MYVRFEGFQGLGLFVFRCGRSRLVRLTVGDLVFRAQGSEFSGFRVDSFELPKP